VAHDLEYADAIQESLDQLGTDHFLDRLKNHPGYKLRVGDCRVLIHWDKDDETLYAIDVSERKNEYRELGTYREVWGSWRDDELGRRVREKTNLGAVRTRS